MGGLPLALLKQNMSLKDSEIRLIVISTDWRELKTPFAEFHWNTHYNSVGLLAAIDDTGFPLELRPIELPPKAIGRMLIPRHWIQVYEKKSNRDKRAIEYATLIEKRGIKNFILLFFYFDYCGDRQYGFYFAQQQENLDFYKNILQLISKERFDEVSECTADYTDPDDVLNEFADAATDMISVQADEKEIGHPEKIKGYLENKMWTIESISRFGSIKTDIRLTDEDLVNDLCGYTGGSHTWYFATCKLSNKAHVQEITERYSSCLYNNDIWRRSIRDYIEYFKFKSVDSTLLLSIFNTENILETIALEAKHNTNSYLPYFTLIIECSLSGTIEIFEGWVSVKNRLCTSIEELVAKYFDGDSSNILMYAHLHAVAPINANILSDLGLEYSVKYKKIEFGKTINQGVNPVVRSKTILSVNSTLPEGLTEWMEKNHEIVEKIHHIYKNFSFNVLEMMSEESIKDKH